jgi:hypothetical protein
MTSGTSSSTASSPAPALESQPDASSVAVADQPTPEQAAQALLLANLFATYSHMQASPEGRGMLAAPLAQPTAGSVTAPQQEPRQLQPAIHRAARPARTTTTTGAGAPKASTAEAEARGKARAAEAARERHARRMAAGAPSQPAAAAAAQPDDGMDPATAALVARLQQEEAAVSASSSSAAAPGRSPAKRPAASQPARQQAPGRAHRGVVTLADQPAQRNIADEQARGEQARQERRARQRDIDVRLDAGEQVIHQPSGLPYMKQYTPVWGQPVPPGMSEEEFRRQWDANQVQLMAAQQARLGGAAPVRGMAAQQVGAEAGGDCSSCCSLILLFTAVWITGLVLWTRGGTDTLKKVGQAAFGAGLPLAVLSTSCCSSLFAGRTIQRLQNPEGD